MAEIRPYDEIYAEQIAQAQTAVDKAVSTQAAQQAEAVAWFDGGLETEGLVVTPGPADPPADD
jgi:hypothetical protein